MGSRHATIRVLLCSWARVEPSRGAYDDVELDAIAQRIRLARAEGAEPVVVLHSGALPDWVIARHGWLDPDIIGVWGCYVDRVAQRVGVHVRWWAPLRGPLEEASFYDGEARLALRALLDAHASAYLHLKRTQGFRGEHPEVGTIATWALWTGDGWRGRAAAGLRERLGPDAWISVLASGKLAPPFALVGELSNGTPALDWIGVDWAGVVRFPREELVGSDDEARDLCLQRLTAHGKPLLVNSGEVWPEVGARWVG
ncbi:hypothetical protein LBMAG42_22010 [Deltaproteobacteria bacterium]|nr:hypothetical protein LBMAG42_22010 [Deltaproteobacteria bacterium]